MAHRVMILRDKIVSVSFLLWLVLKCFLWQLPTRQHAACINWRGKKMAVWKCKRCSLRELNLSLSFILFFQYSSLRGGHWMLENPLAIYMYIWSWQENKAIDVFSHNCLLCSVLLLMTNFMKSEHKELK